MPLVKILYDGLIFSLVARGGISRYFAELLPRVAAAGNDVFLYRRPGVDAPRHPAIHSVIDLRLPEDNALWKATRAVNDFLAPACGLRLRLEVGRPDIFHP